MEAPDGEVTRLLKELGSGNRAALAELTPLVYARLRKAARSLLRNERADHTLQATALVNEMYVRVLQQEKLDWCDRRHFLAIATRTMREILVDHARARLATKRGGGQEPVLLDEHVAWSHEQSKMILELNDVLPDLEVIAPRPAEVIHLRFFAGMTVEETAEALHLSAKTVQRDWEFARAWLNHRLTAQ
jgi:RNA polymerase sigma factor (TIGR02999 family)